LVLKLKHCMVLTVPAVTTLLHEPVGGQE
jgi:hypothetical protein